MPLIDKVVPAPELVGTKGYPRHYEAYGLPHPTKIIQVLVDENGNEIVEGPPDGGPVEIRQVEMWRARTVARATPFGDGTLFDAVEAAINAIEDPLVAAAAREVWERGTVFDLDGQLVPTLMGSLGMIEADILPLMAAAAELPA